MNAALEFDELDPIEVPGAMCCLCGRQLGEGRLYVCTLCEALAQERLASARPASLVPHLVGGELRIPFGAPERYHWWTGGQSILETLIELEAPCDVRARYENPPREGCVLARAAD